MLRTELGAIARAAWRTSRANGRASFGWVMLPIPAAVWVLRMGTQRLTLGPDRREGARFSVGLLAAIGHFSPRS